MWVSFPLFWKSDAYVFQPEFSNYIARLQRTVVKTCQRCHSRVCLACGEPVSADHEKHVATRDDPLFHCSNLQGVILGVGLSMLEQVFNDQNQEAEHNLNEPPSRNIKRRKTENPTEDEDVLYYAGMQGKRAKGGTGYDGDATEDVRLLINELLKFYMHSKNFLSEYWTVKGFGCATGER